MHPCSWYLIHLLTCEIGSQSTWCCFIVVPAACCVLLQGWVWPGDGVWCCYDLPQHQDAWLYALLSSSRRGSSSTEAVQQQCSVSCARRQFCRAAQQRRPAANFAGVVDGGKVTSIVWDHQELMNS
jgi:hypothetical protein